MKLRHFFLVLVIACGCVAPLRAQTSATTVKGNWAGTLTIGPTKLRLVLKIVEQADGKLTAALDSLDQPNSNNLTVDTITFSNDALHFEMKALLIVFDGTLSKDGTEISGTFKQAGNSFPLILRKEGVTRSQAPVRKGQLQLTPCNDPSLTSDALCGALEVYEDRATRTGRKIPLNLVLLPATEKAQPDPLFYLAGGPGGAATTYALSLIHI